MNEYATTLGDVGGDPIPPDTGGAWQLFSVLITPVDPQRGVAVVWTWVRYTAEEASFEDGTLASNAWYVQGQKDLLEELIIKAGRGGLVIHQQTLTALHAEDDPVAGLRKER